jgi:hypothetical protein
LQEHLCLLSEILERELKLSITGAELSTVSKRKGPWAYGVIADRIHQLDSPNHLHSGCPRLVDVLWKMM